MLKSFIAGAIGLLGAVGLSRLNNSLEWNPVLYGFLALVVSFLFTKFLFVLLGADKVTAETKAKEGKKPKIVTVSNVAALINGAVAVIFYLWD